MELCALVVDDSKIMRQLVMRSLRESRLAEFTFLEAEDGQDALDKFNANADKIGICFVDWNMPKMTGIEFVRQLRATAKRHVPVVMVTTERTMGRIEEAMDQAHADSYVVKPFTTDVLRQKIEPLITQLAAPATGFFSKLVS